MTPGDPSRGSEAGFSLVMLFAGVTVMMILMAVAMPSWKYVVQNEREQELFFRGNAIATAIERYQKKNGNAAPPSLEILVKGKYLRNVTLSSTMGPGITIDTAHVTDVVKH